MSRHEKHFTHYIQKDLEKWKKNVPPPHPPKEIKK